MAENSDKKRTLMPLDETMLQLKDALDQWQTLSAKKKDDETTASGNSEKANAVDEKDWLQETRSILERLNSQLDELSR